MNSTITHNPNLARRAWFWHVTSHMLKTIVKMYLRHLSFIVPMS